MEFLFLGSIWFWIILSGIFTGLVISVFQNSGIFSTIFIISMLGFLQYSGLDIKGMIIHHPLIILGIVVGYIVIGMGWMLLKWKMMIVGLSSKFYQARDEWIERNKSGTAYLNKTNEQMKDLFSVNVDSFMSKDLAKAGIGYFPPNAKREYSLLFFWAAYWPVSFIITVLNDPLKKLFNVLIHGLSNFMQNISDKAFPDIK